MRPLLAAAAALILSAAPLAAAWAAAPNDIIWDPPAPKTAAPRTGEVSTETMVPLTREGQPDKNGIIWDTPTPAAEGRQNQRPEPTAPAAKPNANGITWNAPPVKPSSAATAPKGPLLTPPSGRLAQAPSAPTPSADGLCREFQTTIVIDGKREPAHGTVCQQADGTWRVVNK